MVSTLSIYVSPFICNLFFIHPLTSNFFSMAYNSLLCLTILVHKPFWIYPLEAKGQAVLWPCCLVSVDQHWDPSHGPNWMPGARIPPNGWEVTKDGDIQEYKLTVDHKQEKKTKKRKLTHRNGWHQNGRRSLHRSSFRVWMLYTFLSFCASSAL